MKTTFLFCCLLALGFGRAARAQNPQGFRANIVKLAGLQVNPDGQPQHGFVVGTGAGSVVYFVLLSRDKAFLDDHPRLNVFIATGSNRKAQPVAAEQVARPEPLGVGAYELALYKLNSAAEVRKSSYSAIPQTQTEGYRLFWDSQESATGVDLRYQEKDWSEINLEEGQRQRELKKQPAQFRFTIPTQRFYAQAGMPLLDQRANVVGLVAENQDKALHTFVVINIEVVMRKLQSLGKTLAGDECAYFNLLQFGKDETPCEERRKLAEATRESQAKREAYLAGLARNERRVVRHDKNYHLAVSAGGGGYLDALSFSTGSDNNSNQFGGGYSYGLNLHLAPDSGSTRLTLKPRYAAYNFYPPTNYTYPTNSSGFALKQVRTQGLELPVLLELGTERKLAHSSYFALGYAYGWQRGATFTYTTTTPGTAERTETLLGNPRTTHKALVEIGYEHGKARVAVNGAYQFNQFLRRDYEFILNGETITPLQNAGKSYWNLGLEVSYRLWGRWQNGRIYKKPRTPPATQR